MSYKIIKSGKLPEPVKATGTCHHCGCVVESIDTKMMPCPTVGCDKTIFLETPTEYVKKKNPWKTEPPAKFDNESTFQTKVRHMMEGGNC